MSYYTKVDFQFSDTPPSVDEISEVVRRWLTSQELYAVDAVVDDLARGWSEGQTEFNGLISEDIEQLILAISSAFPDIRIHVRGMGEEFGDVWLRQFERGKAILNIGPFEDID